MSQQIINLGSGPDTQTGDTISVAFTKVNDNFTELYSVFDGNGITTINANVIFANNIVTTTNVRTGNLFAYGNIESIGYIVTAGAFYPNGAPIGSLNDISSNLIPTLSNVYTLGSSDYQFSQAYIGSNLTLAGANVTVRNGQLLVNGQIASGNYGNSNVAQYLPVYGGNIAATVTTANQSFITKLGTLTSLNVSGNTVISGNLDVSGTVTYLNVRDFSVQDPIITLNTRPNGAPLISNNGFDSGVRTYYYDSQNKAAFFGRINSTGYFEYYSNVISEVGNIVSGTYGTIKSANLILTDSANITGNVTGNYFLGNGRFLTGIDATSIQNGTSNVKVYLNSNVTVTTAGSNTWTFEDTGNLIFPGGSKLNVSGISNENIDLIAGPGGWAELQSNDANTYVWVDNNAAYVGTNWLVNSKQWTFDANGTLLLPAGATIAESTYLSASSIRLKPSGGTSAQYLEIAPTAVDGNHLHLMAGSGTELFLGDDNQYVKLANTGGVVINSNDGTGNIAQWTFGTDGNLTLPGNLTTTSNVIANYFLGNFVGNISGNISAAGANTQVLFNDDNSVNAVAGLTFEKVSNLLTVSGTVSALSVNVAGFNVIDSNGNVVTSRLIDSGVIAGIYGNASSVPSITVDEKGRVTAISNVAVAGVSNVSYNTVTGSLTISTSSGTNYEVDLGVGTDDNPIFRELSIAGNTTVRDLTVNANATIGGTLGVTGNLIAGNLSATNFIGNAITLGTNTAGQLASNAVTLTSSTSITNSIAQLNFVLGKLVPTAPNNFPGGQSLTISTLSTYRMCNFVQTDNTTGANKSVAGGTSVSNVRRLRTYTTSTIANVGPGDLGTVTAYRNGVAVGNVALIAGNVSGTYGNLVITRSGDYANVSSITPGFWYSFSSSLSGNIEPGWNEVYIVHSGAGAGTNTPYWYYDASAPGNPTWSNTSISLTTNSSTYSSTIPHLNSSSQFTLYGNVSKLSGDMFPSGASSSAYAFVTGTAGGAISTPSSVTYAGAGVTWPLAPNLYVSSGSAYLTTTAAVISGFGSSALGPQLIADNSYGTGSTTINPGVTVLYKTGTSTQIEETSITVTSVGTGSGNALRVINPGSTDTPTITANTAFNSQTSTLQTYDATVVAAILKHDQTNYSTGYLPVGPNLSSGRTGAQYFTFKFTRTTVSKFNISVTGNVGNVWVALPGSTIDNTSTLNGWIDMGTAYSGSGIPGANVSAGGNGSNGCAVGGVFVSNSSGTQSKTCTFGTVSSSSTVSNDIFVRLKLYAGQTVTALSIIAATN